VVIAEDNLCHIPVRYGARAKVGNPWTDRNETESIKKYAYALAGIIITISGPSIKLFGF
jgi:hypothetical protein